MKPLMLFSLFFLHQLKACEEQQATWENQKTELVQRAEDAEDKAEKLEKYNCFLTNTYCKYIDGLWFWNRITVHVGDLNLNLGRNIGEMFCCVFFFFHRYWQEAQTLCRVVSQRLADAQSQSESLEIKYSKAKRLVREYQSRYLPSLNSQMTWTQMHKMYICLLLYLKCFSGRKRGRKKNRTWGERWRREISSTETQLKGCGCRLELTSVLIGFTWLSLSFLFTGPVFCFFVF